MGVGDTLRLEARAVSTCFALGSQRTFHADQRTVPVTWAWSGVAELSGEPLALGTSPALSTLELPGELLRPDVAYVLTATACLVDTSACGSTNVSVLGRDSPLTVTIGGGDRVVGEDDILTLEGAASDPDEPQLALSYAWSLSCGKGWLAAAGCPTRSLLDDESHLEHAHLHLFSSTLTLPAGHLSPGAYDFELRVQPSKPPAANTTAEVVSAVVSIIVRRGALPVVSITAERHVQNANDALVLVGSASLPGNEGNEGTPLTLQWSAVDEARGGTLALDSASVTSTGGTQPNLVLLPNSLSVDGVAYVFELQATYAAPAGERIGIARVTVVMNVPPWGGRCEASPPEGFELNETFALAAPSWIDSEDQLPLLYSFAVADGASGAAGTMLSTPSLQWRLGGVTLPAGSFTLLTVVADQLGGESRASVPVLVKALPEISTAAVDSVLASTADALASGNPGAATQAVSTLAASLNANSDRPPPEATRESPNATESASRANEAKQQRETMLTLLANVTAETVPTAETVGQVAAAVATVLQVEQEVSASALSTATQLVGSLLAVSEELDGPIGAGTASAVMQSVSSMVTITATMDNTVNEEPFDELRAQLSALGPLMLRGQVAGAAPVVVVAPNVQLTVQLLDSNGLKGASIAAPSGGGSVTLPASGLDRGDGEGGSGESDGELRPQAISGAQIVFATLQINTHQKGDSATDLYALEMVDPESGGKLNVSGLASPVLLRMAPTSTTATGGGACEARFGQYNCSDRGACVAGLCECDSRFSGDNCATELRCKFWSDDAWRDDGLSTGFDQSTGQLVCSTTHFTDFMGLHLPTTQDQFKDEIANLIITLPCADGWLEPFDFSENEFLFSVVFVLAFANLLSLPFFRYRYKVRRAWLHVKQKRQFYGQQLARSGWAARGKTAVAEAKQAKTQGTLRRLGTRFGLVGTSSAHGLTRKTTSNEVRTSGRFNPALVLVRNSFQGSEDKEQLNKQDHTITRSCSSSKLQRKTSGTSQRDSKRSLSPQRMIRFISSPPSPSQPPPSALPSSAMSRYKVVATRYKVDDGPANLPSLDVPSACASSTTKRTCDGRTRLFKNRVSPDTEAVADQVVALDADEARSPPPSPPSNAMAANDDGEIPTEEEIARFEQALAAARAASVLTNEEEAGGAKSFLPSIVKAKKAADAPMRGDGGAGRQPLAKETDADEVGPQQPQHRNPKEAAARNASAALGLSSPADNGNASSNKGNIAAAFDRGVVRGEQQAWLGVDTRPCKMASAPPESHGFWGRQVQLRTAHAEATAQQTAAVIIQKTERNKQTSKKLLLQPALQFQMEVAQMRARIVAGESLNLAEAVESAAAKDKFAVESKKRSRMMQIRQSIADSHTALLVRERNWSKLVKHVRHESDQRIRVQVGEVVEHTRDRHTLISVAAPLDLDELDPAHLRDEQAAQIFWNVVIVELVVNAVWAGTSGVTSCSVASNATDVNATSNATFTDDTTASCTGGGNFRILTAIITGMFGAACLIITAMGCRIVFRIGNKPSNSKWLWRARFVLAWGLNVGLFVLGSWTVVAYGRCYTRTETDSMLLSFLVGCGISWGLMEPLFIVLVTMLPCFRSSKFLNWANERANDIGLDLSLVIG